MEKRITISITEYENLKNEIERLQKENQKLKIDNEVYGEVLEYISKGAEKVINEWGHETE